MSSNKGFVQEEYLTASVEHTNKTKNQMIQPESPSRREYNDQKNANVQYAGLSSSVENTKKNAIIQINSSAGFTNKAMRTLNPLKMEEQICSDKYYETLEQSSGFRRSSGFFTQFANQNKIVNDQYKLKKTADSEHSRYISKPVLFTTLNTKNRLSQIGSLDHTQILKDSKMGESKALLFVSTPRGLPNKVDKADISTTKSNQPSIFPIFGAGKNFKRDKLSPIEFMKDSIDCDHDSELLSKQNILSARSVKALKINVEKTKFSNSKDLKSFSAFAVNSQASFSNTRLTNSPTRFTSSKIRFKGSSPSNFNKTFQDLGRYHTKTISDNLLSQYSERTKQLDPLEYLDRNQDVDFMRSTAIAVEILDRDKKYSKKHTGTLEAYCPKKNITSYQEPNTFHEIGAFEENIIGWTKSVPNFGKQRWTYEKDWEFRLT